MKRTISLGMLMGLVSACGTYNYPVGQDPNGGGGSAQNTNVPRTGATVRYLGRVNENATGGTLLSWPGTGIITAFNGKTITVNMTVKDPTDINEMEVVVDGKSQTTPIIVKGSTAQYTVTADTDGTHDLQLIKRTESSIGKVLFQSFTPASSLVATPAQSTRLIEMIGDSITAGYGVLSNGANDCGSPGAKITDPNTESAFKAYGSVAARTLNADVSLVAISGRGVSINNDGSPGTNATEPTMPTLWTLIDSDDTNSTYDFKRQADVVVINLATNDFYWWAEPAQGATVPPQSSYVNAYVKLVKDVRSKYANAQIILALGPMMSDYNSMKQLTTAQSYIKAVVSQLGDSKVSTINFPANSTDIGCNYHPNETSAANMADALVTQIKQVTGWQ